MNTFAHSRLWVRNFNEEKFWSFLDKVSEFKSKKSDSEKLLRKGKQRQHLNYQKKRKNLTIITKVL